MNKTSDIFETGFSTRCINLLPYWRIRFNAPVEEVDILFDQIIKVAPLQYGKTDRNAFLAAAGVEYYRPMEGTPTGAEEDTRKRPGVVEMYLCIPRDEELLTKIIDILYENHSYYEPPISVDPMLRSATVGLDDSNNPNRWWNNKGDWKS